VLDSLVKRGLAKRVDSARDRRVKLAKTTPSGEALIASMLPSHFRETKRVLKRLKRQDKRDLRDLLGKLRQSVLDAGEDPHDEA
jgi:DNA-binding MarR family transcriptional regulator